MNRRRFLRSAGRLLVAAPLLGGCDGDASTAATDVARTPFFSDDLTSPGEGWGKRWLNVRYEGVLVRGPGGGSIEVAAPGHRAIAGELRRMDYLAQPVVVPGFETDDCSVAGELRIEGPVQAGVLARWSYDTCYALLVSAREALLCRYDPADMSVLAREPVTLSDDAVRVTLAARGGRLSGSVRQGRASLSLTARDEAPLGAGAVGVVVNPLDDAAGGRATVAAFRASSARRPSRPIPRFAYRFTGAVLSGPRRCRARVTARTVLPEAVAFDIADNEGFEGARRIGPVAPRGRLGAVHAWIDDLDHDVEYHWRPVARGGRVRGEAARFRTPAAGGAATRFAFGCCTTGRMASYPSFEQASSLRPEFYVHAGDWGYADLNALDQRADHFQSRWTRLLRVAETQDLLATTPLLFWQDDHDYQADNGWSGTVKRYTVSAFDELHANPTDDYFDFRWADVHLWCLDCRLFASDPEAPDDAAKTRLGARQKAWLVQGMSRSDAPVLVVASAMAFRDKDEDDPGWHNVYAHERDELLAFFSSLDARVVILSGDSHGQRLIHHHEFGDLYEITSSGTDFPFSEFGQGKNDPDHTLAYVARTGFALVELDPPGADRHITVRVVGSDGATLIEKTLTVG